MNSKRMLGIALLACGILALAYGGFTYTKSASQVELGPIAFEVQERERVNIPLWIGIGLAVAGGALMVAPGSKS